MVWSFIDVSANSSTSPHSSVVVSPPSGIEDGDYLLAGLFGANISGSPPTRSLPAGFTAGTLTANPSPETDTLLGWKVASSESGSYTFTATGGSPTGNSAFVAVWRDVATPNETSSINTTSTTTAGIGISDSDVLHVCVWGCGTGGGATGADAATTERLNFEPGSGLNLYIGDETLSSTTVPARTLVGSPLVLDFGASWSFGSAPEPPEEGHIDLPLRAVLIHDLPYDLRKIVLGGM